MIRKEWLEKFIELCSTGANTLDFRRHCRIKAQHLPRHTRRLGEYRLELAKLQAIEDEKKRVQELRYKRLKSLEEARRVRAERAKLDSTSDGESGSDTSGNNSETLGTRKDNSQD